MTTPSTPWIYLISMEDSSARGLNLRTSRTVHHFREHLGIDPKIVPGLDATAYPDILSRTIPLSDVFEEKPSWMKNPGHLVVSTAWVMALLRFIIECPDDRAIISEDDVQCCASKEEILQAVKDFPADGHYAKMAFWEDGERDADNNIIKDANGKIVTRHHPLYIGDKDESATWNPVSHTSWCNLAMLFTKKGAQDMLQFLVPQIHTVDDVFTRIVPARRPGKVYQARNNLIGFGPQTKSLLEPVVTETP